MSDYVLKYSHNIIEHLGLKLYQNKPTNVIAELVSNSWDANANNSWIDIISQNGSPIAILATDNGDGMSEAEIINNWLIIAKKKNVERKPTSSKRRPMGRKGIGKLAPFGIGKKVDLITLKDQKLNWLSLDYRQMTSGDSEELVSYSPHVIVKNGSSVTSTDISEYIKSLAEPLQEVLTNRLESIVKSKKGTIIICHDLSLKRVIKTTTLKEALGKRFTVTLNTPSFTVSVNDSELTEEECLPKFILRLPQNGLEEHTIQITKYTANGEPELDSDNSPIRISKTIKSWVGFTANADQSQDQSGIGVFAHGKLAQDRPFTFGSKGLEIKTRYMYGVIEADWIDELEEDIISTDRTSIDWDYYGVSDFYDWGKTFVRDKIKEFDEFKKKNLEKDIDEKIEKKLSTQTIITPGEKKHLRDLLLDVLPEQDLNEEQEGKLIEATAKAWTHEPARKLIKSLWDQTSNFENHNFGDLINQLVDELVPKAYL